MRPRSSPAFFCCVLLLPGALSAQTIQGRMVEEATWAAVVGGSVVLSDSVGQDVARAMTDADGRFTLVAPAPGRYRLRSAVIGWRAVVSPTVALEEGAMLTYTFVIQAQPVRLDSIVVTGDQRCDPRREAGEAVVDVWEEARKALELVSWSPEAIPLDYRWIRYVRSLHPQTLEVVDDTAYERSGRFADSPFKTLTPEALWTEGFVRRLPDGGWVYEGPDAAVFLSDQFAEFHCFAVVADSLDGDLIGLRFRPAPGRRVPEIAGTFWLDKSSGELRTLEFRFVQLPNRVRDERVGGRLEFRRLPNGPWIVWRWWVRMPLNVLSGIVTLFREEGAVVREVRDADGRAIASDAAGTVTGVAYDSLRLVPGPMGGAEVALAGTSYRTRTDEQGRFALSNVTAGTYRLAFDHPDLAHTPPLARPTPISVLPRDTIDVWLGVPSRETLWRAICPDVSLTDEVAALTGVVTVDSSGDPAIGATVAAHGWRGSGPPSDAIYGHVVSAVTGQDGRYVICGVEADGTFVVRAALGNAESEEGAVLTAKGWISRKDLVLRTNQ